MGDKIVDLGSRRSKLSEKQLKGLARKSRADDDVIIIYSFEEEKKKREQLEEMVNNTVTLDPDKKR